MKTITVPLIVAIGLIVAPGCGKQKEAAAPPGPPAAAPGAPPAAGAAPAAGDMAEDPAKGLEGLLRDRVTRFAPSPLWTNRLGRFLLARGQGDEAGLLLEAAAAADPGNADYRLDALLARAGRAGSMQGPEVAHLRGLLGDASDPAPPAGLAAAAPTQAFEAPAPAPPAGGAMVAGQPTPPGAAAANPMMPAGPPPGQPSAPMDPQAVAAGLAPPAMAPPAMANGAESGMAPPGGMPPAPTQGLAPPMTFEDAVAKAQAAIQQGDLARAGAMWQEALKFDAKSADGWLGLADVTLMRGDANAAIGHYKEALRLAPKNAVVAKRLGDACFQSRQNDCAFSAYEAATAGDPVSSDGYVWVRYAHVANQLGKRAVAEKALAAAAKLLPADDRDLNTVKTLLATPDPK